VRAFAAAQVACTPAARPRAYDPFVITLARATTAALLAALSAACAASHPAARAPESPAALATPEPDPVCKGAVQERLLAHGLDQVTVALDVGVDGRAKLVRVLSPELTPAAQEDVRRAFETCPWAPPAAGGERERATVQVRVAPLPAR
jgi:hypothetical protein